MHSATWVFDREDLAIRGLQSTALKMLSEPGILSAAKKKSSLMMDCHNKKKTPMICKSIITKEYKAGFNMWVSFHQDTGRIHTSSRMS